MHPADDLVALQAMNAWCMAADGPAGHVAMLTSALQLPLLLLQDHDWLAVGRCPVQPSDGHWSPRAFHITGCH